MDIGVITLLLFGSMFAFLAMGLPVAFVLGGLAVVFTAFLWGPGGLMIVAVRTTTMMRTIILIAVPLFILMANVLERSGIAEDLYEMMHRWSGPLRGGLAAGTVAICAVMAAMTGVAATGTVTMGIIALPSMLKRGYDKSIPLGCIMAGGALGPLIPPSVVMIVYGSISGVSVGKLFAGGMFPGLLLAALFISFILIRCYLNPRLGPPLPPEERASWRGKFVSLRGVFLPLVLIVSVLGSIFTGMATPTEAAAVGALGALVCAAIHRRFNWELIKGAAFATMKTSATIMWILLAAGMFAAVYMGLGAPKLVRELLETYPLGPWGVLILIQVVWFILGCLVDALSILMITAPIFLPLVPFFGYDPLWFAILFCVNTQMGYLTPPFGANLFYMRGVAPKGITMEDIYRSIAPFVILQAIGLAVCILFPPICTWAPSLLFK